MHFLWYNGSTEYKGWYDLTQILGVAGNGQCGDCNVQRAHPQVDGLGPEHVDRSFLFCDVPRCMSTQPISGEIISASQNDKLAAEGARVQIDSLLASIGRHQDEVDASFVALGRLLVDVQTNKHWITYGFKSFGAYLNSIEGRVKRTQFYAIIGVASKLSAVPESDLIQMGITKASLLTKVVKFKGTLPSPELVEKAKNPDVSWDELEGATYKEAGLCPPETNDKVFNLGYVFFTPEETEEFYGAVASATSDPDYPMQPIDNWQHASPNERKEVLMRWAKEFLTR